MWRKFINLKSSGRDDDGYLEYSRHENIDYNEFDQAIKFGTAMTSPRKLLEIAKEISPNGKYNLRKNNCQTWTEAFLNKVSQHSPHHQDGPNLYQSLQAKLFAQTRSGLFNSTEQVLKRTGIPII